MDVVERANTEKIKPAIILTEAVAAIPQTIALLLGLKFITSLLDTFRASQKCPTVKYSIQSRQAIMSFKIPYTLAIVTVIEGIFIHSFLEKQPMAPAAEIAPGTIRFWSKKRVNTYF